MSSRKLLVIRALILFAIVSIIIISATSLNLAKNEKQVAYVACEDGKIYVIDIEEKRLLTVSSPIHELEIGRPYCIDIDCSNRKLYIGNQKREGKGYMSKKYKVYYPIVVIDIDTMKVVNKFMLDTKPVVHEIPYTSDEVKWVVKKVKFDLYIAAVYEIRISPDGKKIYAGYAHPNYSSGQTVINSFTGEIIGKLNFYIGQNDVFSDDGKKVTHIYPEGITVYDIEKNKKVSTHKAAEIFEKGTGLNSYGKKIEAPFYFIKDGKLKGINRENGKAITEITLAKESDSKIILYPTVTSDNKIAVTTKLDFNDNKIYVIGIDLIKKQIAFKIKIGKNPTNIVLGPICK